MGRFAILMMKGRRVVNVAQQYLTIERATQFVVTYSDMTVGTGSFAAIVRQAAVDNLSLSSGGHTGQSGRPRRTVAVSGKRGAP